MRRLMIGGALALAAFTGGASAQTASSAGGIVCAGKAITVRYGKIKPGQEALFKKAVADHQAWYTAHGSKTKVQWVRVVTNQGGKPAYDDSAAFTIVTYDPAPQPARDAAYSAFVKEYSDSETVTEEHRGCMP